MITPKENNCTTILNTPNSRTLNGCWLLSAAQRRNQKSSNLQMDACAPSPKTTPRSEAILHNAGATRSLNMGCRCFCSSLANAYFSLAPKTKTDSRQALSMQSAVSRQARFLPPTHQPSYLIACSTGVHQPSTNTPLASDCMHWG